MAALSPSAEPARRDPITPSSTLPSTDWFWMEQQAENALCTASNVKGFRVIVLGKQEPRLRGLEPSLVGGLEHGLFSPDRIKKRGERSTTFQGLPCHQVEGTLSDGRTIAVRMFVTDGFVYSLSVVGGTKPVEEDPEFEKIMGGFSFTEPPEQTARNADARTKSLFYKAGQIFGYFTMGALAIAFAVWAIRKATETQR